MTAPDNPGSGPVPTGTVGRARASLAALEMLTQLREAAQPPTVQEQTVLRQWTGWGSLAPAFERDRSGTWAEIGERIEWLLPPDDQVEARKATYSAFYTPPEITRTCWQILQELGFGGGRILEPGCGAGVFMEHTPPEIAADVRWLGVERDPTTAAIAAVLHPDAQILTAPIQKARLPVMSVDAVLGNVPFAEHLVYDPTAPEPVRSNLHNYCLWRSIQTLRPGGVAVLITSRYTLDGTDASARQHLFAAADLLGAIRLPSTAWQSGGTTVTADILVLRRRRGEEDIRIHDRTWLDTQEVPALNTAVNQLFVSRPELVVGTMRPQRGHRYGHTLTVAHTPTAQSLTWQDGMAAAAAAVTAETPDQQYRLWQVDAPLQVLGAGTDMVADADGRPEGSFHLVDGRAMVVVDGQLATVQTRKRRPGPATTGAHAADDDRNDLDTADESTADTQAAGGSAEEYEYLDLAGKQLAELGALIELRDAAVAVQERELAALEQERVALRAAQRAAVAQRVQASARDARLTVVIAAMRPPGEAPSPLLKAPMRTVLSGALSHTATLIAQAGEQEQQANAEHDAAQQLVIGVDADLVGLRQRLNRLYDAYRSRYGFLNRVTISTGKPDEDTGLPTVTKRRPPIMQGAFHAIPADGAATVVRFRTDPHYFDLLALEDWDAENLTAAKHAIFTTRVNKAPQRTVRAESAADAVALCLDEHNKLHLPTIAALLDITVEQVPQALGDLAFFDPDSREWTERGEYLSGNVRVKLDHAVAAAAQDPERYTRNVDALRERQPRDLGPAEIFGQLGAAWIPETDIARFILELLNPRGEITVHREPLTSTWTLALSRKSDRSRPEAAHEWGTEAKDAYSLIELELNGSVAEVSTTVVENGKKTTVVDHNATAQAKARQKQIAVRFSEWLWEDPDRADRLAEAYNRTFNATVLRDYDGSHLTVPGMAADFDPYASQRDMVFRAISNKTALCGHAVGGGKTTIMAMTAVKLRQLGLANKPMIVVLKATLEDIAREIKQRVPAAKLLVADEVSMSDARSRTLWAKRCATGDYDAVIITHPAFTKIGMHEQFQAEYLANLAASYRASLTAALGSVDAEDNEVGVSDRRVKQVEKLIEALEARAEYLLAHATDGNVFFEQLGVDYLLVDEFHYFKNLQVPCHTEGFSMSASKRASDLDMKLSWLRGQRDRVATFFSGTPVSNSMLELYVVQHYLMPERLDELGMSSPDAWARWCVLFEENLEIAPDGQTPRTKRRPTRFKNVYELLMLLSERADIRSKKQLGLLLPPTSRSTDVVPRSRVQEAYIAQLAARAEAVKGKPPRNGADNILNIATDGRKAAIDPELVELFDPAPVKFDTAIDNIVTTYRATRDLQFPADAKHDADTVTGQRGGFQLVFCDLGTPSASKKKSAMPVAVRNPGQVYAKIRDGLIAEGIPRERIRFIHDAKSDQQRAQLFADCRTGTVSVLIASTEKGGVGVNVQDRLVRIHHVDAPWRPSDIEQREGRGERPGNRMRALADLIAQREARGETVPPQWPRAVEITTYVTEGSFDSFMWGKLDYKSTFISQLFGGKLDPSLREIEDIGTVSMNYAEVKALATGNALLMDLAKAQAQLKILHDAAAAHTRTQRRLETEVTRNRRTATGNDTTATALEAIAAAVQGCAEQQLGLRTSRDEPIAEDQLDAALVALAQQAVTARAEAKARRSAAEVQRGVEPVGAAQDVLRWYSMGLTFEARAHGWRREILHAIIRPRGVHSTVGQYRLELNPQYLNKGQHYRIRNALDQLLADAPRMAADLRAASTELRDRAEAGQRQVGKPFPQRAELDAVRAERDRINTELASLHAETDAAGHTDNQHEHNQKILQLAAAAHLDPPSRPRLVDLLHTLSLSGTFVEPPPRPRLPAARHHPTVDEQQHQATRGLADSTARPHGDSAEGSTAPAASTRPAPQPAQPSSEHGGEPGAAITLPDGTVLSETRASDAHSRVWDGTHASGTDLRIMRLADPEDPTPPGWSYRLSRRTPDRAHLIGAPWYPHRRWQSLPDLIADLRRHLPGYTVHRALLPVLIADATQQLDDLLAIADQRRTTAEVPLLAHRRGEPIAHTDQDAAAYLARAAQTGHSEPLCWRGVDIQIVTVRADPTRPTSPAGVMCVIGQAYRIALPTDWLSTAHQRITDLLDDAIIHPERLVRAHQQYLTALTTLSTDPDQPVHALPAPPDPVVLLADHPDPMAPTATPTTVSAEADAGRATTAAPQQPTLTTADAQLRVYAEINQRAAAWFDQQLDASTAALTYLTERLGSPDRLEAVRARPDRPHGFTIGFAPHGWTGLVDHLRGHGYRDQDLVDAGVAAVSRRGTLIDRFRDRITFAIHDNQGRIAGFTARDISNRSDAKYLNTPATALFDKSVLLFGLYEQQHLAAHAAPTIMEGPFDVIATAALTAEQHPLLAVAPCGTALTPHHLAALDTVVPDERRRVFALDPDTSGRSAMLARATEVIARYPHLEITTLPDGVDPAAWALQNDFASDAIGVYLDAPRTRPAVQVLVDTCLQGWAEALDRDEVEARIGAARDVAHLLAPLDPARVTGIALDVGIRLRLGPDAMAEILATARNATGQPLPALAPHPAPQTARAGDTAASQDTHHLEATMAPAPGQPSQHSGPPPTPVDPARAEHPDDHTESTADTPTSRPDPAPPQATAPEPQPAAGARPLRPGGVWSRRITIEVTGTTAVVSGTSQTDPPALRQALKFTGFRWRPAEGAVWKYVGRRGGPSRDAAVQAVRDTLAELDRIAADKASGPTYPPTPQQQQIIDACLHGRAVAVRALAGTGKTSTLRMVAAAMPDKQIVYLAFNRAIADEAQDAFGPNVVADTMHAFARQALRSGPYQAKLGQVAAKDGFPNVIATALGMDPDDQVSYGRRGEQHIEVPDVIRVALRVVKRFRESAATTIDTTHLPGELAQDQHGLADLVLDCARRIWSDKTTPTGVLPFTHDDYLKIWALTNPSLPGEVIFFDEVQDSNELQAALVQAQPAQVVVVGDSYQSIYGFRGARDFLATWPAEITLPLTQSWRFGPTIAETGNLFLGLLRSPLRLEGNPGLDSRIDTVADPDAVLCRTNAGAVTAVIAGLDAGKRVALVGGASTITDIARAAQTLMRGRRTNHPDLSAFASWQDARTYVNEHDDAQSLRIFVRLVDKHSPEGLIAMADQLVDEEPTNSAHAPQLVVSTAHKAKGREWNSVRIADDFPSPTEDPDTNTAILPATEELRLAYVTVTRAKHRLDLGSLAWITHHAGPAAPADTPPTPARTLDQPESERTDGLTDGPAARRDALSRSDSATRAAAPERPDATAAGEKPASAMDRPAGIATEPGDTPAQPEVADHTQPSTGEANQVPAQLHTSPADAPPASSDPAAPAATAPAEVPTGPTATPPSQSAPVTHFADASGRDGADPPLPNATPPTSDERLAVARAHAAGLFDRIDPDAIPAGFRALGQPQPAVRALDAIWLGLPIEETRLDRPALRLARTVLSGLTQGQPVDADRCARQEIAAGHGLPTATALTALAGEFADRHNADGPLGQILRHTPLGEVITQLHAIADRMAVHGQFVVPGRPNLLGGQESLFDLAEPPPDAGPPADPATDVGVGDKRNRDSTGSDLFERAVQLAATARERTAAAGGHNPEAWLEFSELVRTDPATGISYAATQPHSAAVAQWWIERATAALDALGYRVESRAPEGRRRHRAHQIEADTQARLIVVDAAMPLTTTAFNVVAQVAAQRATATDDAAAGRVLDQPHSIAEPGGAPRETDHPAGAPAPAEHQPEAQGIEGEEDLDAVYAAEGYTFIEGLTDLAALLSAQHWSLMEEQPVEIGGMTTAHWRRHDYSLAVSTTLDDRVLTVGHIRRGPWESPDWEEIAIPSAHALRDLIEQAGLRAVARPARLPGLWRVTITDLTADASQAADADPTARVVRRAADDARENSWVFADGTPVPLAPPLPVVPVSTRADVIKYVLGDHARDKTRTDLVSVIVSGRARNGIGFAEAARQLAAADLEMCHRALAASAGRGSHRGTGFDVARARDTLVRLAEGDPALPLNTVGQQVEFTLAADADGKRPDRSSDQPSRILRAMVTAVTPQAPNHLRLAFTVAGTTATGTHDVAMDAVLQIPLPSGTREAHDVSAPQPGDSSLDDVDQVQNVVAQEDTTSQGSLFDLATPSPSQPAPARTAQPPSRQPETAVDPVVPAAPPAASTDAPAVAQPGRAPLTDQDLALAVRRVLGTDLHRFVEAMGTAGAPLAPTGTTTAQPVTDDATVDGVHATARGLDIRVDTPTGMRTGRRAWKAVAEWLRAGLEPTDLAVLHAAASAHHDFQLHQDHFAATGHTTLATSALTELAAIRDRATETIIDRALQAHTTGTAPGPWRRTGKNRDPLLRRATPAELSPAQQEILTRISEIRTALPAQSSTVTPTTGIVIDDSQPSSGAIDPPDTTDPVAHPRIDDTEPMGPLTHSDVAITLQRLRHELVQLVGSTTDPNALRRLESTHWGRRSQRGANEPDPHASEDIDVDRKGVRITVGYRRTGHWTWRQLAAWLTPGITPARTEVLRAADAAERLYYRHRTGFLAIGEHHLATQASREIDTLYRAAVADLVNAAMRTYPDGPATPTRRRTRSTDTNPAQPPTDRPRLGPDAQAVLDRLAALTAVLPTEQPTKPAAHLVVGDILAQAPGRGAAVRLTEAPVDNGDRVDLVGVELNEYRPGRETRFSLYRHGGTDLRMELLPIPASLADLVPSPPTQAHPARPSAQPSAVDRAPDEQPDSTPARPAAESSAGPTLDTATSSTGASGSPPAPAQPIRAAPDRADATVIDRLPNPQIGSAAPPLTEQWAIQRHRDLLIADEPARLALTYLHQLLQTGGDAQQLAQTVLNVAFRGEAELIADRLAQLARRLNDAGYTEPVAGTDIPVTIVLRQVADHVQQRHTAASNGKPPAPAPHAHRSHMSTPDDRSAVDSSSTGAPPPQPPTPSSPRPGLADPDAPTVINGNRSLLPTGSAEPRVSPPTDPAHLHTARPPATRPDPRPRTSTPDRRMPTEPAPTNRPAGTGNTSDTMPATPPQNPAPVAPGTPTTHIDEPETLEHIFTALAAKLATASATTGTAPPSGARPEPRRGATPPHQLMATLRSLTAKLPAERDLGPVDRAALQTEKTPQPQHSLAAVLGSLTTKLAHTPAPGQPAAASNAARRRPPLVPVGVEADRTTNTAWRHLDPVITGRERATR